VRRVRLLLLVLLAATPAGGEEPGARVLEHRGRWESGYGVQFYNVVGRLRNTSGHPVRWVSLRVEALDEGGKVVAATAAYNESAEALSVPDVKPEEILATGRVKPLAAGAEDRFRASFLKDETPPFKDHRVTVVETPVAR
jgi:hypothetical protein